jgi:hypothetical protein
MRVRLAFAFLAICALFAALLVAAEAPAPSAPSYAKDIQPLFVDKCGTCHGGKRAKGDLDLSEGKGYKNLVGAESPQAAKMLRVKPGNPDQSLLWLKLDFQKTPGDPMPKRFLFGPKKLPQAELDLVKAWIAQGAKE